MTGSLIVKMAGSIRERLAGRHVEDPLAHGEGLRLSTELPDREVVMRTSTPTIHPCRHEYQFLVLLLAPVLVTLIIK